MNIDSDNELIIKKIVQDAITFANNSFAPIFDVPEELEEYLFVTFFNKNNPEHKNEDNKTWWKFLVTISYVKARIYILEKTKNLTLLENSPFLTSELNKWNGRGSGAYKDLTAFLSKFTSIGLTYSAAHGFWILWNMKNAMPSYEETRISSAIGAFILTSVEMDNILSKAFNKGDHKNDTSH